MAAIFHLFLVSMLIPLIVCAPNISRRNQIPKRNENSIEKYRRLMFYKKNVNNINNVNKIHRKREIAVPCHSFSFDMISKTVHLCDKVERFYENVNDYPSNEISEALNNTGNIFDDYFSSRMDVEIANRFDDSDKTDICDFHKRIYFPQRFGKELYIVSKGNKVQGFPVEVCSGKKKSCEIPGNLPNWHTSVCIQKYAMKSLVTYSKIEKKIQIHEYEIPSCCSCQIMLKNII